MSERSRRRFTVESKAEAVRLVEESGQSLPSIADELAVHVNQLRTWRREELAAGSVEARAKRKSDAAVWPKRECKRLEQENEFLK